METIIQVLKEAELAEGGKIIKLPDMSDDMATYYKIKKTLESFAGKYKTARKVFEFSYDFSEILNHITNTGVIPDSNPYEFFPTPQELVKTYMPDLFTGMKLADFSAGTGAIAEVMVEKSQEIKELIPDGKPIKITLIEIDKMRAEILKDKYKNNPDVSVIQEDFLGWNCEEKFDIIFINPPFSIGGDIYHYMEHVRHAWEFLAIGGKLISVIPQNWRVNSHRKCEEFQQFIYTHGVYSTEFEEIFKQEKVASIKIDVITLDRLHKDILAKLALPYEGELNSHVYDLHVFTGCSSSFVDRKDKIKKDKKEKNVDAEIAKWYKDAVDEMRKNEYWIPFDPVWIEKLKQEFD